MIPHLAMHDPAYKRLFSHPRMIQDLLHGFATRDWSNARDFATLKPVPASFYSRRQRHGDLVWQVRFHDRWLYLMLLLEFQSDVDHGMAVRILTYTGLLYGEADRRWGVARARRAAAGAADRDLQRVPAVDGGR